MMKSILLRKEELGLKLTWKQKRYLYYLNRWEKIMKEYNPCDFKGGKCINMRAGNKICCKGCRLLTSNGCSSINIYCKTFLCPTAFNSLPKKERNELDHLLEGFSKEFHIRDKYSRGYKVEGMPSRYRMPYFLSEIQVLSTI